MTSNQTSKSEIPDIDQLLSDYGYELLLLQDNPLDDKYDEAEQRLRDLYKQQFQSILEDVITPTEPIEYYDTDNPEDVGYKSGQANLIEEQWERASKYNYKKPEGKERS